MSIHLIRQLPWLFCHGSHRSLFDKCLKIRRGHAVSPLDNIGHRWYSMKRRRESFQKQPLPVQKVSPSMESKRLAVSSIVAQALSSTDDEHHQNSSSESRNSLDLSHLEELYDMQNRTSSVVKETIPSSSTQSFQDQVYKALKLKPNDVKEDNVDDDILSGDDEDFDPTDMSINDNGLETFIVPNVSRYRVAGEQTDVELYGSPDPLHPMTDIPCSGCGALLHCQDPGIPGYLPSQKLVWSTKEELKLSVCQRCYLLREHNLAVNVCVSTKDYAKIIKQISGEHALVVMVVDVMDFPNSIYKSLPLLIGTRRPLYVVGNKIDLLPKDSPGYLNRTKDMIWKYLKDYGFTNSHYVQYVTLISAKTGYGVEELITHLMKHWFRKGHVYLVGCTNVGKSSLYNDLLASDYCNSTARDFIHRATVSSWPGTTLSTLKFPIVNPTPWKLHRRTVRLLKERPDQVEEDRVRKANLSETGSLKYATLSGHIGQTFLGSKDKVLIDSKYQGDAAPMFEFSGDTVKSGVSTKWKETKQELHEMMTYYSEENYQNSRWCYDTPGVVNPQQVINLLTQKELGVMLTRKLMQPRTFVLKPSHVLLVSGLGRLDYVKGDVAIYFTVIASMRLPVLVMNKDEADHYYQQHVGTQTLGVPLGDQDRLWRLPSLIGKEFTLMGIGWKQSMADILLSSIGWVAVTAGVGKEVTVRAFTPGGLGCDIRTPSLLCFAVNQRGKRIRNKRTYEIRKPMA